MERLESQIKERFAQDANVLSVTVVQAREAFSPVTDGFDILILIVTEQIDPSNFISHYIKDGVRIQERWVARSGLEQWIATGLNRNIIQWILDGKTIHDRQGYLQELQLRLLDFPKLLREQRLFVEFTLFLRTYLQSKSHLLEGNVLDAYSSILDALHHWARIVVVEAGRHPEVTVWKQVYSINPGVYKLYEELTASNETVEQRVRLVLLASEFSVMSKMKKCCTFLFDVLGSRTSPWSLTELKSTLGRSGLRFDQFDLPLVLNKLVTRQLIAEVLLPSDDTHDMKEIRYALL